ncbi:MAG: GNAT family N-acetyltransferase [Phycisphaerales bacterium]|nr:GNAT family N-acetyltransferase [Phycisphaerales bacterium]
MSIAIEQSPVASIGQGGYWLSPFDPALAERVANWVSNDDELFWLAPKTIPPLTADKILNWPGIGSRPMFLRMNLSREPLGYLELNNMPGDHRHFWVGHCIIDPDHRGKGLGQVMIRLLLEEAFQHCRGQRVSLVVFPDNLPAIRCYQALGFRHVGWQSRYFPVRGDYYSMWHMAVDARSYRRAVRYDSLEA